MNAGDVIIFAFLLVVSCAAFIISFFQFKERGFLFNNAYLYAPKKERETMNKKPHYRQSAIIFLLLGIIFLILALETLFTIKWLYPAAALVVTGTIIYAIVSSADLRRKDK